MTARLLISPAGAGKSMWVAREAKEASEDFAASPVICVARPLQVFAMFERLSAIGGALGVRVMTFDRLATECLTASRVVLPEPGREVTFRVLQSTIRSLGPSLEHFGVLADRPGLAEEVRRLLVELELADIGPEAFELAIEAAGRPARLRDIAAIYTAYKAALSQLGWSDRPGILTRAIGTLAPVDSLPASDAGPVDAACRWSHLFVDGFDDLSAAQLELLAHLAGRVGRLDITLTGDPTIRPDSETIRRVHHRFASMAKRVERRLGIKAEPLPASPLTHDTSDRRPTSPSLRYLERTLYADAGRSEGGGASGDSEAIDGSGAIGDEGAIDDFHAVEMIEAPDRASEAREALRWIKARIIRDDMEVHTVALLARDVEAYRAAVLGIAAEMGIPIRLAVGLPLASNPAVAAILEVLRLSRRDSDGAARLPRRQVVDAWRSPYFDWSSALHGFETSGDSDSAPDPDGVADADVGIHVDTDAGVDIDADVDSGAGVGADVDTDSGADSGAAIADALDAVARWGNVIGGEAQWREAFERLLKVDVAENGDDDEERGAAPPAEVPTGSEAAALLDRFDAFVRRLQPAENATMREHVRWIEGLIGRDPLMPTASGSQADLAAPDGSLQIVARCRRPMDDEEPMLDVEHRDISALEALKDVLRALVAADEALAGLNDPPSISFDDFLQDLAAAVEAAVHTHDHDAQNGAVLLSDVPSARGLPFRAVALLGVAEGEFPATISENPFLRDAERTALRTVHGLEIANSTDSSELEYFYETITRPSERLLLTRPRLADNGALWKASPFWEEVVDLTGMTPRRLNSSDLPALENAAGRAERFVAAAMQAPGGPFDPETWRTRALALDPGRVGDSGRDSERAGDSHVGPARVGDSGRDPTRVGDAGRDPNPHARWPDVVAGAEVLRDRARDPRRAADPTPFDGDLSSLTALLTDRFGPRAMWSPSAIETMVGCGFRFFVERGIGLRPREEPAEGLNAAQLGTIYHDLLERVYEHVPPDDRTNADALMAALDEVADPLLDRAPDRLGFRPTAWWRRTRDGIKAKTRSTLQALCEPDVVDGYTPIAHERSFGRAGAPPLVMEDGDDRIRIRGVIDRVDRAPDGRLRIVDYKTAGPSAFAARSLVSGDKLQIALYALAARDALNLGQPTEGFYWHVQKAEASPLKLSRAEGGVQGALHIASQHTWSAVRGVRDGRFAPTPPKGGCPTYCAAASFCWRYAPPKW